MNTLEEKLNYLELHGKVCLYMDGEMYWRGFIELFVTGERVSPHYSVKGKHECLDALIGLVSIQKTIFN